MKDPFNEESVSALLETPDKELASLEDKVQNALDTLDVSQLPLLGVGEVSCVLQLDCADGRSLACKRLPVFRDEEHLKTYSITIDDYIEALKQRDVRVAPSVTRGLPRPDGRLTGYLVQPMLPAGSLVTDRLRALNENDIDHAVAIFARVAKRVVGGIGPPVGIDSQLSNWALLGDDTTGEVVYLDVTTPFLRDEYDNERVDAGLFLAAMPWLLRGFVRRFLLRSVISTWYAPRTALIDCLGNLIKERLEWLLPAFCEYTADCVDPPISEQEVRRYYRSDARLWATMLLLRRLDRWWNRKVRRRQYPFLLPHGIER